MDKTKTAVIHHSADFDGIFCREIARKFLPEAELIGWDFADPPLRVPDGQIYVMDLPLDAPFGGKPGGFNMGIIMAQQEDRLVWIDHHASAIKSHAPETTGYRIDGVAACRLAWCWFDTLAKNTGDAGGTVDQAILPTKDWFVDRKVSEPLAVRLAGEYDIWDKRDPNAELFQHGLRSRELTDGDWRILLGNLRHPTIEEIERMMDVGHPFQLRPDGTCDESVSFVEGLLNNGRCLQYAKTQENASIIQDLGFTFKWEGVTFLACNAARYNSHLFTAGLTPEHDACFGFKWTGKDWSVSLYHAPGKEHHDLSLIAVKHGGGGHRGACGFKTAKLPFLN